MDVAATRFPWCAASAKRRPQLIDKTEAEDYVPGDEYVYWPN